jgi:hypothetical protein
MLEDAIDESTINLDEIFDDIDDDALKYSCSGQKNISVVIDQATGMVTLAPHANWSGEEMLNFSADDNEAENYTIVKVIVAPQNDPPRLKLAGKQEISAQDQVLEFTVLEDDEFNLTLVAEDIDGDTVLFSTNRTDNIGNDDISEFQLEQDLLNFYPMNAHVGSIPINISISDGNGSILYYKMVFHVVNVNDPPIALIIYPVDGTQFQAEEAIEFRCEFLDPDFDIQGSSERLIFTWSSSLLADPIASGENLSTLTDVRLEGGTHLITLTVEDSGGAVSEDEITIIIEEKEVESKSPIGDVSSNMWWLLLLVMLLIIILIAAVIFLKRRKEQRAEVEHIPPAEAEPALPGTFVAKPGAITAPAAAAAQMPVPGTAKPLPVTSPAAVAGLQTAVTPTLPVTPATGRPSVGITEPVQAAAPPIVQPPPQLPPTKEQDSMTPQQPIVQEGIEGAPTTPEPADAEAEPTPTQPPPAPIITTETEQESSTPKPIPADKIKNNEELLEKLEDIGKLKELGLMSEEEFEQKKRELLG